MRECVNCEYSRGTGSDVWCGHEPKGKESYMEETDCPYFEPIKLELENIAKVNKSTHMKETQLDICEKKVVQLEEDLDYYKAKCASLETNLIQGQRKVQSYDDFTLHSIEMEIKNLIAENERIQNNIRYENEINGRITEWLILENRVLVLYELLTTIRDKMIYGEN